MGLHDCKFDRKYIFATASENLTHKLRLGIHYAAQRKPPCKNAQLWQNLAKKYLSYIFEFQLVPFAFSLILGDPFMVSPSYYGEGAFFQKMLFMGDKICGENL